MVVIVGGNVSYNQDQVLAKEVRAMFANLEWDQLELCIYGDRGMVDELVPKVLNICYDSSTFSWEVGILYRWWT